MGPALPALGHATSGAAGTAISKLITYPLDVVITRLQVQKQFQSDDQNAYEGILDAAQRIYNEEGGVGTFYNGISQEILKGVADSFLFFLAYTYIGERRRVQQGSRKLSALDEIGVGALAGAFSKFFTTPIQNIVTRKQTAAMVQARHPTSSPSPLKLSAKDIAVQIRAEKGLQGFWSGYSASLVLTLNPSITFLMHKIFLRLLVSKERRGDPGARMTFLIAAISKALASTVTYPFSLAKTRAQVSSQKPSETLGPTSESEKPREAYHTRAARARQRTVFSTIIRIARTEGLWALYEGLGAEVLKGFFSHGITMLMKDQIHTVIINVYYLVLKSLKQYPSPEELAKLASEQAQDVYKQGKGQVSDAYQRGVEAASHGTDKVHGIAEAAVEKVQEVVRNGEKQVEDLFEKGEKATMDGSTRVSEKLGGEK